MIKAMAQRQREWAMKAAETLRGELGACCVKCGDPSELEFDCIRPMGDRHHKMEWSWRLSFYRAQAKAGNLQLLCERCHNKKSSLEHPNFPGVNSNGGLAGSPALPKQKLPQIESSLNAGNADRQTAHRVI